MKELHEAEKSLKTVLQLQKEEIREASQNLVSQYLKIRKKAKESCSVSQQVISGLTHQINVLESVKLSGVGLQPHIKQQMEEYLQKYKRIREQLITNNRQVQSKQEQKKQEFKFNNENKMKQKEQKQLDNSEINYSDHLDNEQKLLHSSSELGMAYPTDEENRKQQKSIKRRKMTKRWVYMSFQYTNSAIFTLILLHFIFLLIFN